MMLAADFKASELQHVYPLDGKDVVAWCHSAIPVGRAMCYDIFHVDTEFFINALSPDDDPCA